MIQIYQTTARNYLKLAKVRGEEQLFVAVTDGELSGYCKYRLAEDRVILLDLYEADGNIPLADALVKATVAAYRDKLPTVECTDGGLLPKYKKHSGLYKDNNREAVEHVLRGHCGL